MLRRHGVPPQLAHVVAAVFCEVLGAVERIWMLDTVILRLSNSTSSGNTGGLPVAVTACRVARTGYGNQIGRFDIGVASMSMDRSILNQLKRFAGAFRDARDRGANE